jgi:ATP-dependent helicase/nuclease subunit A
VVHALVNVPGAETVTTALNTEQLAAVHEPGVVFVSAGAGTGKTAVLVERYVQAVVERGLSIDAVLVITYTERAAGELRTRIRERLLELDRRDLAQELDRAWISTIHGLCSRLLRSHPFEAGLDPRFRILDESQARILRSEAFTEALASFCSSRQPERLQLLATYGAAGLASMLARIYERLRSAGRPLELSSSATSLLTESLESLREIAEQPLDDPAGHPEGRAQVERALELIASKPAAENLLDLSDLRIGRSRGEHYASFDEALSAVAQSALDEVAARDRELLQELLQAFDRTYGTHKARESALDFEDLQLVARDLLSESETIRERLRWRFRAVMVDEFQDTNRLQCEVIDLLGGDELFFVGDEFQSIYRFRHADVGVFRARRAASGGVLALTQNYRSRPELLSVVNHLFGVEFGGDFEPLVAAGRFPDPIFAPAVELLVTDKSSYRDGPIEWREAEARHIAGRVRELVDAGECLPGEVVLLFAAGTDAERYETALREEGLRTNRAAGRGYFAQQQVFDLLAYLRLLHNRYDDAALVTVLASPLVGLSNDALFLVRRAAPRRPLFTGLERELPAGLSARDRRLLVAFRQRYERLAGVSASSGLEVLCDRIVVEHDYDLAVLAQWDGRRRYANLRKLARLASSYEELRGPDVEGFVRFLRDQEAAGVKEVEAVAEEEGSDAVRLLTIHAAKGLEFKVVVVADAGRGPAGSAAHEILCLPDGRFGFRIVDPTTGERRDTEDYEEIRRAEKAAEEAETRRLLYVAMTRAMDRLIVSGALDPTKQAEGQTSIRWLLERLDVDLAPDGPVELERGGARFLLRVDRRQPQAPVAPALPTDAQLHLFPPGKEGSAPPAPELPPLTPVPVPPPPRVRRLSYSALALFERCSYRFYIERIVGLWPVDGARDGSAPAAAGLAATEIGDAVHVLLELEAAESELEARVLERYPGATAEDLGRVAELVAAWRKSELAGRLAAAGNLRAERGFAFEHDGVLLHGRLDLFGLSDGRALVVDYKTNRLEGRAPHEVVDEEYGMQRLVYALAALRSGADDVEIVYVFLEQPDETVSATFSPADLPGLERKLSEAIAAIQAGDFRPTPSEFVCLGCPALDVVCAGPALRNPAPPPVARVGADELAADPS